jgi:hypothetical protein
MAPAVSVSTWADGHQPSAALPIVLEDTSKFTLTTDAAMVMPMTARKPMARQ